MARKLQVEIVGNSRDLERAFGRSASAASGFGSRMARVGRAVGVAGLAMSAGIVFGLKKSIDSANDHAVALSQTEAGIKSTGGAANVTAKQITTLADAIEKKTGVDDLAVQAGQNMLLTFTKVRNEVGAGNQIFNRATLAVTDLSVRLGKDAPASALMLGKALNDPLKGITALGRAGIQFTAEQKTAIAAMVETGNVLGAQKAILKEVETQVGGSAVAFGKTLPGQLNILKGHLDDVGQRIGQRLVPALTSAVQWVTTHWPEISAVMEKVMTEVGSVIGSAVGTVRRHWETIRTTGQAAFGALKTTISGLGNFISNPIGSQVSIAIGFFVAFGLAAQRAQKAYMAMKAVFTVGAFSSPFGLVIGGIGILGGIIASQLLPDLMSARRGFDSLGDGAKAAADQILGVKDAIRGFKDAQAEAQSSNTAYKGAMIELNAAIAENAVVHQKHKANSEEAIRSDQRVAEATDGVAQAWERKKRAQEDAVGKEAAARKAVGDTTSEIFKQVDAYKKIANEQSQGKVFAENFRKETEKFTSSLTGARNAHLAHGAAVAASNPQLAANQRQIALNDQIVIDLTRNLGRVPKRTEIELALKNPEKIAQGKKHLNELPPAAAKAGKDATEGLTRGLAPMGERAQAAGRKVAPAIAGQAGSARSGGFTTGSAAGQGVVAGINSQIPAIRAAAAYASAASVITMQRTIRAGSPSLETKEKVGVPLAQGLIEGFTNYLKSNGTKIADATKQAIAIAAAVTPAIQAAGNVLGLAKARAIAMGVVQGAPGLKQQVLQALSDATREAIKAASDRVREAKDAFASQFGELGSAALAAFDSKVSQFQSIFRKRLEESQLKEQIRQMEESITKGRTGVTEAKTALGTAEAGGDPAAITAAKAQVLAAEESLRQALLAKQQFNLEQQARKDEEAHAKKMERKRVQFQNELTQAQNWINEHPKAIEEGQKRIEQVLRKHLGSARPSGAAIGYAIAQGLRDSIKDVENAAEAVARAIAKRLKLKSPAETGPLADLDRWATGFAPTWLKGLDMSAISNAVGNIGGMPALAGAGAGPMPGGAAMAGVGATTININLHGGVYATDGALDDLAAKIQRKVTQRDLRVGRTQLSTSY